MAQRMEQLNKAREEHGFTNLQTTDGRILFKRPNENKNNLFYHQKLMWCFCTIHERKSLCCFCKNLFFILGVLCIVFLYQKNCLTGIVPLINKLGYKKLISQFFNHCFIISFVKSVAMILLQILKSTNIFLVLIIILLSVKKRSNV